MFAQSDEEEERVTSDCNEDGEDGTSDCCEEAADDELSGEDGEISWEDCVDDGCYALDLQH